MALKAGNCASARRALWRSLLTAPRLRTLPPALASLLQTVVAGNCGTAAAGLRENSSWKKQAANNLLANGLLTEPRNGAAIRIGETNQERK